MDTPSPVQKHGAKGQGSMSVLPVITECGSADLLDLKTTEESCIKDSLNALRNLTLSHVLHESTILYHNNHDDFTVELIWVCVCVSLSTFHCFEAWVHFGKGDVTYTYFIAQPESQNFWLLNFEIAHKDVYLQTLILIVTYVVTYLYVLEFSGALKMKDLHMI